jgi:hypothetical protein
MILLHCNICCFEILQISGELYIETPCHKNVHEQKKVRPVPGKHSVTQLN